ncbi:mitochondrial ribosomal protein S5 [Tachypleus tridentatus]|uniref:mitochondrial ribosomal protein S5 n=1 Tax=Tachypleus tridentatus TaxID=6853 RepID=UPI003FD16072
MAASMRVFLVRNVFQSLVKSSYGTPLSIKHLWVRSGVTSSFLFADQTQFFQSRHSSSIFTKLTAEQLWKGVTSVSNAGKKRGRGKGVGKKTAKDLNKGQVIGVGKINMIWPGLNAPVLRGKEVVERRELPPDKDREEKLLKMRDEMGGFRPLRISPLERGWSGTKMPGRSIGPPDSIGEDTFEGFDTKVLEMKTVFNMKANFGRTRRMSVLCVTGNKNGLAGFALGKSPEGPAALRKAKNRAAQKLRYIERFENHTVFHDFYTCFGKTKIFVKKKPKGFGLVCHRAIKTICEIIGIKDLYAKVEGSTNINNLTRAFFLGLQNQKTHQQLAQEKGLHVVEFREERDNFPQVIASPSKCRTMKEIDPQEVIDYNEYISEGKVELIKPKRRPFYEYLDSWEYRIKKIERFRNHQNVHVNLLVEHGKLTSFLNTEEEQNVVNTEHHE